MLVPRKLGKIPTASVASFPRLGWARYRVNQQVAATCNHHRFLFTRKPVSSLCTTWLVCKALLILCTTGMTALARSFQAASTLACENVVPNRSPRIWQTRAKGSRCRQARYTASVLTLGPYCAEAAVSPAGKAARVSAWQHGHRLTSTSYSVT